MKIEYIVVIAKIFDDFIPFANKLAPMESVLSDCASHFQFLIDSFKK